MCTDKQLRRPDFALLALILLVNLALAASPTRQRGLQIPNSLLLLQSSDLTASTGQVLVPRQRRERPRKYGNTYVPPSVTNTPNQPHQVPQWSTQVPDHPWDSPQQHFHNLPNPDFDEATSFHHGVGQQSSPHRELPRIDRSTEANELEDALQNDVDQYGIHSYIFSTHNLAPHTSSGRLLQDSNQDIGQAFSSNRHAAQDPVAQMEADFQRIPNFNSDHSHKIGAMTSQTFNRHLDHSSSSSSVADLNPSSNREALVVDDEKKEKILKRETLCLHKNLGPYPRFALRKSAKALLDDPELQDWLAYRKKVVKGDLSQDQLPYRFRAREGAWRPSR